MKSNPLLLAIFAAISFYQITIPSYADSLYPAGPGRYGGNAYRDSSGNYYNSNPKYGQGLYGGGVIQDKNGRNYNCNQSGQCTDAGFSW
jgi:hypothetical protein